MNSQGYASFEEILKFLVELDEAEGYEPITKKQLGGILKDMEKTGWIQTK